MVGRGRGGGRSGVTLSMDGSFRAAAVYRVGRRCGQRRPSHRNKWRPLKAKPRGAGLSSHLGLLLNVTWARMDQRPAPTRRDGTSAPGPHRHAPHVGTLVGFFFLAFFPSRWRRFNPLLRSQPASVNDVIGSLLPVTRGEFLKKKKKKNPNTNRL